MVQLDPTTAVAPSADVVLWSRLGGSYAPSDLRDALDSGRLVELDMMARPAEDLALLRAEMTALPAQDAPTSTWRQELQDWVASATPSIASRTRWRPGSGWRPCAWIAGEAAGRGLSRRSRRA